jgi:uncharacterized protein (DUF1697 family)
MQTNLYVAFLRGINVGGNNNIKMTELKADFEKLGFTAVQSYINSGNIVFKSNISDILRLEKMITDSLFASFGYKIKVLIRTVSDIENTIAHFPAIFADPKWKHNIIFLGDSINSPHLIEKYQLKPGIETTSYFDGVLYWSASLDSGTRAIMYKLSTQPEYQDMTVRSIGTVKKILKLMYE